MCAIDPDADDPKPSAGPLADWQLLSVHASGGSMFPFILDGDVIHVQRAAASELKKGTVAVYRIESNRIVAHRFFGVVRKRGVMVLRVRGDASDGPFAYIDPGQLLGQVIAVQRGNKIREADTWYWRLSGLVWARTWLVSSLLLHPRDWPHKLGAAGTCSRCSAHECTDDSRGASWGNRSLIASQHAKISGSSS